MKNKIIILLLILSINIKANSNEYQKKECSVKHFKNLITKTVDLQIDFKNFTKKYKNICLTIDRYNEFDLNDMKKRKLEIKWKLQNFKYLNYKFLENNFLKIDKEWYSLYENCNDKVSKESYSYYKTNHEWIIKNFYEKMDYKKLLKECEIKMKKDLIKTKKLIKILEKKDI
jgi:hypothetical protein